MTLRQHLLSNLTPEQAMQELERFVVWRTTRKWVCINGVWERNLTKQSNKTELEVYEIFKEEHAVLEKH